MITVLQRWQNLIGLATVRVKVHGHLIGKETGCERENCALIN